MYTIHDENGNLCFSGKRFASFDDADNFLCGILDDDTEYYITKLNPFDFI